MIIWIGRYLLGQIKSVQIDTNKQQIVISIAVTSQIAAVVFGKLGGALGLQFTSALRKHTGH